MIDDIPNAAIDSVARLFEGAELDSVERALVELVKAGVITSYERGLLQIKYLRSLANR